MKKIEINNPQTADAKDSFSLPPIPEKMCTTAELNINSPFILYADKHGKPFFKSPNGYYLLDSTVESTDDVLVNGAQGTVKVVVAITPNYTRSYFFVEKTGGDTISREVKLLKAIKKNVNQAFPFLLIQNIQYSQTEGGKTSYYSRYEKGGDLQQHQAYIQEQCKLKNDAALSYVFHVMNQLVEGLDALHNGKFTDVEGKLHSGIVHNDLKPANIFVRTNGDVVIADFGCAYYADQTAFQYGTLSFTAPELFLESTEFCKVSSKNAVKADIFSLGLILTLLLQGNLPEKRIGGYVLPSHLPDVLDTQLKYRKWAKFGTQVHIKGEGEPSKYLQEFMGGAVISANIQVKLLKRLALIMQLPLEKRPTGKELNEYLCRLAPYFGTPEERAEKSRAFAATMLAAQEEKSKTNLTTPENRDRRLSR